MAGVQVPVRDGELGSFLRAAVVAGGGPGSEAVLGPALATVTRLLGWHQTTRTL